MCVLQNVTAQTEHQMIEMSNTAVRQKEVSPAKQNRLYLIGAGLSYEDAKCGGNSGRDRNGNDQERSTVEKSFNNDRTSSFSFGREIVKDQDDLHDKLKTQSKQRIWIGDLIPPHFRLKQDEQDASHDKNNQSKSRGRRNEKKH